MTCKREVVVRLSFESNIEELKASIHPRGCMKARQDHLDIVLGNGPASSLLKSLARPRGTSLPCIVDGGCVILRVPEISASIRLCVLGYTIGCRGHVYLMLTRGGRLYVAGVELAPYDRH